jgi:hypothetical protein
MNRQDRIYQTNDGSAGTLDGEPSAITDGIDCAGYRYATCITKVTANATDTATMEVWLGYITSAPTTKPITVEWVKDTRIPGGSYTATEGTAGDTAKVDLEISGADRLYHRWQAQTDADVRIEAHVKLHNPSGVKL